MNTIAKWFYENLAKQVWMSSNYAPDLVLTRFFKFK